ncbi:MAG: DNA gyrase inhibitor YacG [Erythrobacter sp.]|uniref:DNA gyrase inhibitor YacG n=2 Tax=Alphaproteobacteria TaxID=28211 RepID=UPI0032988D78
MTPPPAIRYGGARHGFEGAAAEIKMNTADGFKVTPLRPRAKCPECGKPSARPTFPFCSTRCKDVDLNRWLSGRYVIPGDPADISGDGEDGPS